MGRSCWQATMDGRYWIDIEVGGHDSPWMLDLGLVDPSNWLGFEATPLLYDQLKKNGKISHTRFRFSTDSGGHRSRRECGLTLAQLVDPLSRQQVGPKVPIYISRSVPGVPPRVDVVFFHRLSGCQVLWDLGRRNWCVEYP